MGVGKVYLVGAGPGDPGLITVRGAAVLALADVVLHDALTHPALLAHARAGAEVRSVGKRYGEPSPTQDAINDELVALGRAGKVVARLKGGDPLLFARGAEEATALHAAGIPFEIVPGVPSPTAAAAYAGISLTHRDLASSVALVTGTEQPGKGGATHDWAKLATATQTLCLVMSMRSLADIARALVEHGRPATTPALVVQWGSWSRQRIVEGTVADIAERAAAAGVANPAVVIIGEVAGLRASMSWFDTLPLFGRRIVVTRAEHQAGDTARLLRERGAEPVLVPAIELAPPPDVAAFERAVLDLRAYDAVAFTSSNTVDAVFASLAASHRDARAFGTAAIAAIGPGTASALAARGVLADIVAEEHRGEGLARALLAALPSVAGRATRVLLPRARVARDALPDALRAAGVEVDVVAAYETRAAPAERVAQLAADLRAGAIDAVLFTASSTVTHLCDALGPDAAALLGQTTVASIGPITSDTARARGVRVDVTAATYTLAGLLDALEQHFAASGASAA